MSIRSFSLKSAEAEAALREPLEPHIWAGGLPREPRWPGPPQTVDVSAEDEDAASAALGEWLGHVEAGRIG